MAIQSPTSNPNTLVAEFFVARFLGGIDMGSKYVVVSFDIDVNRGTVVQWAYSSISLLQRPGSKVRIPVNLWPFLARMNLLL